MPTSRTKRLLFSGAAAIGVAAGAAGTAGAATGGQSTPSQTPTEAEADGAQDPSYTSSVTAPEAPESQPEADEAAALEGVATVTADQARDAALSAMPGTAGEVELDNENGNVVWSVEITAADGTITDVKVDAGNAAILAQDSEDDSESEADEANEAPEADEAPEAAPAG